MIRFSGYQHAKCSIVLIVFICFHCLFPVALKNHFRVCSIMTFIIFIYLLIYLFTFLFICLFIYLFIYLFLSRENGIDSLWKKTKLLIVQLNL